MIYSHHGHMLAVNYRIHCGVVVGWFTHMYNSTTCATNWQAQVDPSGQFTVVDPEWLPAVPN